MGYIVIVAYRPKPGKKSALKALSATHVPRLRAIGLATDRAPILMEAADGTVVEVFEWVSEEAVASAHSHPEVQAMWKEYVDVCDYVPVGRLEEAGKLFSGFRPL